MKPGPVTIYECSHCGHALSRGSLSTANTLGAVYYSDGKIIASMFPDFPKITKCPNCNTYLWIENLKQVGRYDVNDRANAHLRKIERARFLTLDEYFEVLDENLAERKEQLRYLRIQIWWEYNHRIRKKKKIFRSPADEARWKENLLALLPLFEPQNPDHIMMTAEIHRNLGNFDQSLHLIKKIPEDDMTRVKSVLTEECEKKNRWLVRFN